MQKHYFTLGGNWKCGFKDGEEICNKRSRHLIHKIPKATYYKRGEIVGRYAVGSKGQFVRIKGE